ncbi:MAG: CotH kinase family protein [Oscillospiraceae bacterium]|nr:CotH kinase family protein [Oscillospiraceae bacterium]
MVRFIILAAVLILGVVGVIFMSADADEGIEAAAVMTAADLYEQQELIADDTAVDSELPPVEFSHTQTFYADDINIELSVDDPEAVIFFTTDGSTPTRYSQVYAAPIHLRAGDRVRAMTIKAVALYFEDEFCDGFYSPIVTNSYIASQKIWTRFSSDTYIFMLSAAPYDLYDYNHGIAIEGFLRDDYIENERGGRRGGIDPPAPANFNIRGRESERDFYVEVYDFQGNTLIHQAAGGRIQGGWSRAASQKSWRLIARGEYSDGKFRHAFFDDTFNYHGQLITRFDRLILRNGANDREHANIRDELGGSLAKQAGFPDVQSFAPAAVFMNGEYYGFAWLKESLCLGYLVQSYGGLKENYEIIQKSEAGRDGEERAVEDWAYAYGLAESAVEAGDGFLNDAVFEEFCSLVDIDNFMLYYAIQTYIDNRDWPGNNMRMWRYYADDDEIVAHSFNDGKWRFLMYDVEFAFGIYGQGDGANTLSHVLGGRGSSAHMGGQSVLLQAVLQREDMREKFANTICDLVSGVYSTENMNATLAAIAAIGDHELEAAMLARTVNMWDLRGNRQQINSFARRRPQVFLTFMKSIFEIPEGTEMFDVTLNGTEGADAWLNTRKVSASGEAATTAYFTTHSVPLRAELYTGYEFASWEVNGVHYYEADMQITASMADASRKVSINLHTEKVIDSAPLLISELNASGGADWVTLYNPNQIAISTKSFYLSDDINNLTRWKIPTISIPSEESLTIVMRSNNTQDALMKPQTNFNLSAGETLFLSDTDGEIIAWVEIPETEPGEILTRASDGTYFITAY